MKTQQEYLEEYRAEHGTKTYMGFQILFQLIGGILMVIATINLVNGNKSDRNTYIVLLIAGAFLFIIGFIFLKLSQSKEVEAQISWERYRAQNSEETNYIKKTTTLSANEWRCSKCGNVNKIYVGTCGCGQIRSQQE